MASPVGGLEEDEEDGEEEEVQQVEGEVQSHAWCIPQVDVADTATDSTSTGSEYDTEDEAYNGREPAVLIPAATQPPAGQPLLLEVDETGRRRLPASLPLVMMTNARSLYNKIHNFKKWLLEIFPDCALISESWECEGRRKSLEDLLASTPFRVHSYRRPRGRTGGCCAVIYNETRFKVEKVNVNIEEGIESVWVVMTPRVLDHKLQKVKRVCVCSVYIAPRWLWLKRPSLVQLLDGFARVTVQSNPIQSRSEMKSETMPHIIQTIHYIRSKYDNEVHFVVGGDVNNTDYSDIINSYGALK